MDRLKGKLITKHRKGCYALAAVKAGRWDTPWAYTKETGLIGGAIRRQSGQIFICNDAACPARLGIKFSEMSKVLPSK